MNTYLLQGIVHPERASIPLMERSLKFTHVTSGIEATAHVSIIYNQIAVWVETEVEWDKYDLKNVAMNIVQGELSIVGYLKGFAYEVEIRRILNREKGIDYVYGIDVPIIAKRNADLDFSKAVAAIRSECRGKKGIFIHLCLMDLTNSMKYPHDTGFYCYRAVEALYQHCVLKFGLDPEKKEENWVKFREAAGCSKDVVMEIKDAADPVRHGGFMKITSKERARLFEITWDIVDGYLRIV